MSTTMDEEVAYQIENRMQRAGLMWYTFRLDLMIIESNNNSLNFKRKIFDSNLVLSKT